MKYHNSNTVLYLDGKFQKAANTTADIYGQSLHYGYAVFEGIRAYHTHNGTRIFKIREHFERLKKSAELVNMPFPWDINNLIKQTYKLLELNNLKDAYIRPLVYAAPNMQLVAATDVSIMICAWEWGAYLGNQQLKVCISSYERPNPKSTPIEAKVSGNYVNSILATTEAKRKGFDEALLLDMNGNIAEAPGANIFIEKNGRLYTPPLGNILAGITRATVIELCRILDIELVEKHLTVKDLKHADSAFFCGTATEIAGIASVDEYQFPIRWNDSVGATIQRTYKCLVLEKQNYEVII
ncbi:branched-chain amino acid aminotransferase [Pedobacter steynii]|jgi:branched-chain amino acid aminotransferase|uniref:Branched-chain-amino-acid aminotransferase n=1 Tax=Pedobacter steynii TaxID=430522 RepID=A0A1H0G9C2_9SPHI|nr:branched-chain amino acid transaminase [Pedobacter steynii]NQX42359.1 branched-chain amino acid transaminase [Pedobacter steynii]SDO03487.1 branched-chain amino acid aminotransferase [Pedobacter steynii]